MRLLIINISGGFLLVIKERWVLVRAVFHIFNKEDCRVSLERDPVLQSWLPPWLLLSVGLCYLVLCGLRPGIGQDLHGCLGLGIFVVQLDLRGVHAHLNLDSRLSPRLLNLFNWNHKIFWVVIFSQVNSLRRLIKWWVPQLCKLGVKGHFIFPWLNCSFWIPIWIISL